MKEGQIAREKISYVKYLFADYPIKINNNIISIYADSLKKHFNKKIFQAKFEKSFSSLLRECKLQEIATGYKEMIAQIIIERISDKLLHSFGAYLNSNYKDTSIKEINKVAISYCKFLFSERKRGDEISIPIEHYIQNTLLVFSYLMEISKHDYKAAYRIKEKMEKRKKKSETSSGHLKEWKIAMFREIISLRLKEPQKNELACVKKVWPKYREHDKNNYPENIYRLFRNWYKSPYWQKKYPKEIIPYLKLFNPKYIIK